MICPSSKKDGHYNGKWNGLGGKVKGGETPIECAVREVFEESGLMAQRLMLAGFLTFPRMSGGEDWYCFVFTCRDFSGSLRESEEGKLSWVEDEKIFERNLWEGDKYFLPYVLRGELFTGKFIYYEGKLTGHHISKLAISTVE